MRARSLKERYFVSAAAILAGCVASGPAWAAGSNMPWEQPLNQILQSVQGPVAKIIADPDRVRPLDRLCGVELLSDLLRIRRRGGDLMEEPVAGFVAPVHRALTEPILMGGAPRSVAIVNGTLAAALGLGLRLWLAGLLLWFVGHMVAVWAAKRDPAFVEVVRRHLRIPSHLGS